MMTLSKETVFEHLCDLEQDQSNNLGIVERAQQITIDGIEIEQSVSLLHESTGAMVWQSTLELAKRLQTTNLGSLVSNKVVVEVGCGTGALARLVAAKTRVYYATDQKPLLNLVRHNTKGIPTVKVVEFDWEESEWESEHEAECIIACDTIYNEYLVPHLIDALKSICDGRSVPIIIAMQIREPDMLLNAFELLLDVFTMEHHCTVNGVAIYIARPQEQEQEE